MISQAGILNAVRIINRNTVKATLTLFTKKMLWRDISTVHLYKKPLSRSISDTNFILTVGCITVIVIWGSKYLILMLEMCMVEGSLCTCVLLKVLSPDSLAHYFQSVQNNDIFEVRGVQIENIQNRMVSQNSLNETINFNLSCAVALYSLSLLYNETM